MIEVFIAGLLFGLALGGASVWIWEKQEYIRYVQEQYQRSGLRRP